MDSINNPSRVCNVMDVASSSTESIEVMSDSDLEIEGITPTVEKNVQREGLPALPGCIYQLKLLMLLLKRGLDLEYRFRLGTEIGAAYKFNDLVLEIPTEKNQKVSKSNQTMYRLFQAKHKENESKPITFRSLLTEIDGPYSLVKYFHSYQDTKGEDLFKDGEIFVTLCTNINFNFKSNSNKLKIFKNVNKRITIGDAIEEKTESDNVLGMENETFLKKPVRYRFKKEIAPFLKSALLHNDLPRLAERLAICFLNKQSIDHCTDTFFKIYHGVLAKEVIDTNNKKFFVKFIDETSDVLLHTRRFREMFIQEIKKISPETDFNKINDYILENEFVLNLSPGFGEGGIYKWSPSTHIKDFLKHLDFAVNLPNEIELGEIIKNSIGREFDISATEHVYNDFFIKMLDWLKSKGKGFISHEDGKRLFDESKKTLCALRLSGFTLGCQSIIEKYNIIFKRQAIEALQLQEFLSQEEPSNQAVPKKEHKQICNIITTQNIFSAIKVHEILNSMPEYKKEYNYICMNINSIFHLQDHVIQTFGGYTNLIVINYNSLERNIIDLYSHLRNIIQSSSIKKNYSNN